MVEKLTVVDACVCLRMPTALFKVPLQLMVTLMSYPHDLTHFPHGLKSLILGHTALCLVDRGFDMSLFVHLAADLRDDHADRRY